MPFAVTHTSGPKSLDKNCRSPWGPRYDLDMKAQRRAASFDSRNDLQKALVKDYETTVGTRSTHAVFLHQILNEVQRYQVKAYGNRIPDLALELMAEGMADEMAETKVDHYSKCLSKIGRRRVYSSEFIDTAIQMVQDHHKQRHLNCSDSSSQGLSDGDGESV